MTASPTSPESASASVQDLGALVERLKMEAKIHAQEAHTANTTIAEIYRIVTGGTGEPGNWNGAEPVRKCIEDLRAKIAAPEAGNPVADEDGNLPRPFCGGKCDPTGWLGGDTGSGPRRGPECDGCGATADTLEIWNSRPSAADGARETPIDDKAHPRFMAGYDAGMKDARLSDEGEKTDAQVISDEQILKVVSDELGVELRRDLALNFARAILALRAAPAVDVDSALFAEEILRLRGLAAACYAGLGSEHDLPEAWLDVLEAAASGEPFSTEGLLPYTAATPVATQSADAVDERAAFEAWIAKDGGDLSTFGSGRNIHYHNSAVNNAWGGWKERAARSQSAAAAKEQS